MDEQEYSQAISSKRQSRLNAVTRWVNARRPKAELDLDEAESAYYDELTAEANAHLARYGFWPTFEMGEIDYDDPILDIYGDDDPGEWYRNGRRDDTPRLVEVPEWVKREPRKYMEALMTLIFEWEMFGKPSSVSVDDVAMAGGEWTAADSRYVYGMLVEHGYVDAEGDDG